MSAIEEDKAEVFAGQLIIRAHLIILTHLLTVLRLLRCESYRVTFNYLLSALKVATL